MVLADKTGEISTGTLLESFYGPIRSRVFDPTIVIAD